MYNAVSNPQRSFSWKGGGYIQSTIGREKTALQGVLPGNKGLAEVGGCGFELSCLALLDLLCSRTVVQEQKRQVMYMLCDMAQHAECQQGHY